jgi:transcriptional regulator with XRE-family HTH domain
VTNDTTTSGEPPTGVFVSNENDHFLLVQAIKITLLSVRYARGVSQDQIAVRLNVTRASANRVESHDDFTMVKFLRHCAALGVAASDVLDFAENLITAAVGPQPTWGGLPRQHFGEDNRPTRTSPVPWKVTHPVGAMRMIAEFVSGKDVTELARTFRVSSDVVLSTLPSSRRPLQEGQSPQ